MNFSYRSTAIVGISALAALGLSACSPPNENPSDQKVATATGVDVTAPAAATPESPRPEATPGQSVVAAEDTPMFINCLAAPARTPEQLSLDCVGQQDALVGITWTAWDANEARGMGTRVIAGATPVAPAPEAGAKGEPNVRAGAPEPVEVVLANPIDGPSGLVFSTLTVDGAPVVLAQ